MSNPIFTPCEADLNAAELTQLIRGWLLRRKKLLAVAKFFERNEIATPQRTLDDLEGLLERPSHDA